ncbi:MAG: hypothetical protein SFV52_10955 [Saprospiraceae bacterium]|nr:hypothetical protein [Saprospiraceae bacterium]
MKIELTVDKTIQDVQQAFHEVFPYLRLMFFKKKHEAYEGNAAKDMIEDTSVKLGSLEKKPHSGVLYLEANMPTWQVERLFEEEFGLHVQVFRKSKNLWLQTSRTDDLTLEMQNAKGRASEFVEPFPEDPIDIREQE